MINASRSDKEDVSSESLSSQFVRFRHRFVEFQLDKERRSDWTTFKGVTHLNLSRSPIQPNFFSWHSAISRDLFSRFFVAALRQRGVQAEGVRLKRSKSLLI
jgi:hypothetical protein